MPMSARRAPSVAPPDLSAAYVDAQLSVYLAIDSRPDKNRFDIALSCDLHHKR